MIRSLAAIVTVTIALTGSGAGAQSAAPLSQAQEDAVVALARLYGVSRYFCPSDATLRLPWDRWLVDATDRALRVPNADAIGPMLREAFAPLAPHVEISKRTFPAEGEYKPASSPVEWRHQGLGTGQVQAGGWGNYRSWRTNRDAPPSGTKAELDRIDSTIVHRAWNAVPLEAGWYARVRLSMSSGDALITRAQDEELQRLGKTLPEWDPKAPQVTRAQAIADGIAVWSVARHFYPYWADAGSDWDAAFRKWVRLQPETQARPELVLGLRRLMAAMADGHAGIWDTQLRAQRPQWLPITVRPLGEGFVVTGTKVPDLVAVGDEIESIDGKPVAVAVREMREVQSGSPQFVAWAAQQEFVYGPDVAALKLGLRRGSLTKEVELRRSEAERVSEARPAALSELRPGVRYVDLTRTRFVLRDFEAALPQLSTAKAIIFDLRGYPDGEVPKIIGHWVRERDSVKWMQVPIYARPSGPAGMQGFGWDVSPKPGLERVRKILLLDARAVSFSESVAGYFVAHANGTVVGEASAGANGNVSTIELPGGLTMRFTGMIVADHSGRRIHAKGFVPDVPVTPTLEGIRAGRDEVLERALEIAQRP